MSSQLKCPECGYTKGFQRQLDTVGCLQCDASGKVGDFKMTIERRKREAQAALDGVIPYVTQIIEETACDDIKAQAAADYQGLLEAKQLLEEL